MPGDEPVDLTEAPDGRILAHNLCRLGYCEHQVKTAEVARLVTSTGHQMSRQRVAQLLNAVRITDSTFAVLAKALAVGAAELKRRPKIAETKGAGERRKKP